MAGRSGARTARFTTADGSLPANPRRSIVPVWAAGLQFSLIPGGWPVRRRCLAPPLKSGRPVPHRTTWPVQIAGDRSYADRARRPPTTAGLRPCHPPLFESAERPQNHRRHAKPRLYGPCRPFNSAARLAGVLAARLGLLADHPQALKDWQAMTTRWGNWFRSSPSGF
jgi:hypothetical protein